MDNLTHSLVGALIGQAGLKRKTGLAMPALIIGANLPDVDAACFLWLDGVEHLGFRRGITHGPIAWVLLPLLLAGALYGWDRWQQKRGKRPEGRLPVHFGWLYALSFIACLTHPALDWLNVYGIRLLEPFSSRWFYGDVLFTIDVWLWAILGIGLWLSLRREKRGVEWKRSARIALSMALAYIGINGWITRDAERLELVDNAYGKTIASPVPLAFWERELVYPQDNGMVAIIPGYTGWTSANLQVQRPWNVALAECDLDQARRRDDQVAAFLFWSRAPFARRAADGSFSLFDARFYDPRAADRFTVRLPPKTCAVD